MKSWLVFYAAPTELKSLFYPNPVNRSRLRRFQSRSPGFSAELKSLCYLRYLLLSESECVAAGRAAGIVA
jgi:hypothetical protein